MFLRGVSKTQKLFLDDNEYFSSFSKSLNSDSIGFKILGNPFRESLIVKLSVRFGSEKPTNPTSNGRVEISIDFLPLERSWTLCQTPRSF